MNPAPSWLDKAIGYVSPQRGLRRAQARVMTASLSYEAARMGRRTSGWTTTGNDADGESQGVVTTLRDRARDLVRNNPYAAAACDVKVTETIGSGIVAEVNKNKRLREMWERFVENCDADGRHDFYGIQALAERSRFESGESLIQFVNVERSRDEIRKGLVPFALRVMEADFIDSSRDTVRPGEGPLVRYGIEYANGSKPTGYYLFKEHPGAVGTTLKGGIPYQSERVDADDVIHLFRRIRPQQSRGVTDFAPVILRMKDSDDVDDAEVMRKKLEACLSISVTQPAGGGSPLASVTTDDKGRIEQVYPGAIHYGKPGEVITFNDPKASGGFADFQRFTLRAIATGVGIPYELLTGDLSQVNYSSYRAGLIRFRRRLEQDQWQMLIPHVCARVWDRFLREAQMITGNSELGMRTKVEWTPPRFELIDPLKETQAEIEAIQAGLDTWPEVVRRRGWVASEQLETIEAWQKDIAKRGVVLTSDPRTSIAAKAEPKPEEKPKSKPVDEEDAAETEEEAA